MSAEWQIIRTGRRNDDAWCAISREGKRLCFQTPVDYAFGRELEHLTKDHRMRTHGIVVWDERWTKFYIVARHLGWTPDDYFIHAAKKFGEHGIEVP